MFINSFFLVTYKYEYFLGKGTGDLYIKANCGIIFTEIYERDVQYANIGDTDKSSDIDVAHRYTLRNWASGKATLVNANNEYEYTIANASNYSITSIPKLTDIKQPFKLSVEFDSDQFGLFVENTDIHLLQFTNSLVRTVESRVNSEYWTTLNQTSGTFSKLRLEIICNGSSITFKAYQGTTQVYSYSITKSSYDVSSNTVRFGIMMHNGTSKFKNIIAELL